MIGARDADLWARELGISRAAVDLYLSSEVIDLHLDTFIWQRLCGYDMLRRHATPPLGGWFLGHADLPRVREANLAGATWVITTNPIRDPADRFETLLRNLGELKNTLGKLSSDFELVTTDSEYRAARANGRHAAFLGIQGGNALEAPNDSVERLPPGLLLRVTLVHLTNSCIGTTSSPLRVGPDLGLTRFGRELVARLNRARILVDLAHTSVATFWDAVQAHDPTLPWIVTHTGVSGVHRHWRNLDDGQLRAVADCGGVVGILFHSPFLGDRAWAGRSARIAEHLAHVVRIAGEDVAAIGTDFDGAIIPPRDLSSVLQLPRLVEELLRRGFSDQIILKILGKNFLNLLKRFRP